MTGEIRAVSSRLNGNMSTVLGGFIGLASGVYRLFCCGVWRPEEIFLGVWRLQNWKRPRLHAFFLWRLASRGDISLNPASTKLEESVSTWHPRDFFLAYWRPQYPL